MKILVINAGSSSLKYQLIDMASDDVLAKGLCDRISIGGSKLRHKPLHMEEQIIEKPMNNHSEAVAIVLSALLDENYGVIKSMDEITAIGHRVVHGGEFFSKSVLIDSSVKDAIRVCAEMAPLHNPANLIGIEACEKAMPNVPQVAVFDTAFHQTMPPEAYLYAIPYRLYEKYKIRKYGFHGTSHKYVSQRAAKMLGRPIEELKLVTMHLGNGSSVAAVKYGKSIDTSMGFTPLAGVIMGTRSGLIDPAIIPFLMNKEDLTWQEVDNMLNRESGVLGISGISSDLRDIEVAAIAGNERAKLSLNMFAYSVKRYIGLYASAMGGIDAIIFTAGIGENNTIMRELLTNGQEFIGIEIDKVKNLQKGVELDISIESARVRTLVIPTNEEFMIAKDTIEILSKLIL